MCVGAAFQAVTPKISYTPTQPDRALKVSHLIAASCNPFSKQVAFAEKFSVG